MIKQVPAYAKVIKDLCTIKRKHHIKKTAFFEPILPELDQLIEPSTFIGRCPEIVQELVDIKVKPALEKWKMKSATSRGGTGSAPDSVLGCALGRARGK